MTFFNNIFFGQRHNANGTFFSPFTAMSRGAAKGLAMFALFLIGLGVLVLVFPMVLAFFVAGLFFLIALLCLRWSWRIYRQSRFTANSSDVHIDVEINEIE